MKIIRRSQQARLDRYPGVPRYGLADSSLGSKGLHVGDLTYRPGSSVPHHIHPDAEETQIMLAGELECWLDGERFIVRAGDCVVAKRNVGHAFFNRSDATARMITAFAVSPPITEHTDNPHMLDAEPSQNVVFNAWPQNAAPDLASRHPVNAPGGAAETECEMHFVPTTVESVIHAAYGRQFGTFCVEGSPSIETESNSPFELQPGDFVLADASQVLVRNSGQDAAKLLVVYSMI